MPTDAPSSSDPVLVTATPDPSIAAPTNPAASASGVQDLPTSSAEHSPQQALGGQALGGWAAPAWLGGTRYLLRMVLQAVYVLSVVALILLAVGLAQRTGWIADARLNAAASSSPAHVHEAGKRYVCPMMCTPPSSQPGKCPVCGMQLVAVSSSGGGDGKSVTIEPSARRLIGIQTAVASRGAVQRAIRTTGSIDYDESRLSTISAYVDGRLERMYGDYVGVPVKEGDDLALIYSPQLYSAQTEYLASLESDSLGRRGGDRNSLVELSYEKLSELGMTAAQIETLRNTRKPQSRIRISSKQRGTVIEKAAVEGDYVKTGQKLYQIADLTSVWLMLDLFPDDAALVRFGQQVEAELRSYPGEVFTGRVAFVNPTVDAQTRTVRVRVEMTNVDGKLRPGDYATATIHVPAVQSDRVYDPALAGKYISPMHPQVIQAEPGQCPLCGMKLIPTSQWGFAEEPLPEQEVISVPRDAVLMAGGDSVVYVETAPGRFEVRRINVGTMTDDEAVIIAGLAAGEKVATHGNFLIDSQMQLAGNPSLLDPSRADAFPPGPLNLEPATPVLMAAEPGAEFDRTYAAYFDVQTALAADKLPPDEAVKTLSEGLSQLVDMPDVPASAQRHLDTARGTVDRLAGNLETAREGFRELSHAMLKAAAQVRGPLTANALTHFYCSMVPGGGGDWMQRDSKLANPYWGSKMLRCGEQVGMAAPTTESAPVDQHERR